MGICAMTGVLYLLLHLIMCENVSSADKSVVTKLHVNEQFSIPADTGNTVLTADNNMCIYLQLIRVSNSTMFTNLAYNFTLAIEESVSTSCNCSFSIMCVQVTSVNNVTALLLGSISSGNIDALSKWILTTQKNHSMTGLLTVDTAFGVYVIPDLKGPLCETSTTMLDNLRFQLWIVGGGAFGTFIICNIVSLLVKVLLLKVKQRKKNYRTAAKLDKFLNETELGVSKLAETPETEISSLEIVNNSGYQINLSMKSSLGSSSLQLNFDEVHCSEPKVKTLNNAIASNNAEMPLELKSSKNAEVKLSNNAQIALEVKSCNNVEVPSTLPSQSCTHHIVLTQIDLNMDNSQIPERLSNLNAQCNTLENETTPSSKNVRSCKKSVSFVECDIYNTEHNMVDTESTDREIFTQEPRKSEKVVSESTKPSKSGNVLSRWNFSPEFKTNVGMQEQLSDKNTTLSNANSNKVNEINEVLPRRGLVADIARKWNTTNHITQTETDSTIATRMTYGQNPTKKPSQAPSTSQFSRQESAKSTNANHQASTCSTQGNTKTMETKESKDCSLSDSKHDSTFAQDNGIINENVSVPETSICLPKLTTTNEENASTNSYELTNGFILKSKQSSKDFKVSSNLSVQQNQNCKSISWETGEQPYASDKRISDLSREQNQLAENVELLLNIPITNKNKLPQAELQNGEINIQIEDTSNSSNTTPVASSLPLYKSTASISQAVVPSVMNSSRTGPSNNNEELLLDDLFDDDYKDDGNRINCSSGGDVDIDNNDELQHFPSASVNGNTSHIWFFPTSFSGNSLFKAFYETS